MILQIVARDADAFAQLYKRYRSAMFGLAYRIARDAALAEDAVQDACLQIWRDGHRYDPARGPALAWLFVIVRGRTLDRLRARQTQQDRVRSVFDGARGSAPEVSSWRQVELRDSLSQVTAALDVLPDADRRSIELAYYEGLTHTEIAERLDVPLGTAKTQLRRGMQILRTAVDDRPRRPFRWRADDLARHPPVRRLANRRVLIVDDEPDTLRLTTLVLRRAGAHVTAAVSGQQAIDRLESDWPDLAFIDLEMPEVDGYAVMSRLRVLRARVGRALPTVAFTAQAAPCDRERTRLSGFDLHMAKPISPSLLVDGAAGLLFA